MTADQRYYASTFGRFMTADPYMASGGPSDPGSWNRYTYTGGDPSNGSDPSGLFTKLPNPGGSTTCTVDGIPVPCDETPWCWHVGLEGFSPFTRLPMCDLPMPWPHPQAPPPSQRDPECFAQLKDRPVNDPKAAKVDAVHTFWWVQDETGTQYIISAGPTAPNSSGTEYLNVSVTVGNDNGSGDSSSAHTVWNSGLSSINCFQVDALIGAGKDWKNNHNNTVVYHPIGALGFGGPNSNSAAHYFGTVSGFNPKPPTTAYGWWTPIVFP